MKIYICEDNPGQLELYSKLVREAAEELGWLDCEYCAAAAPEQILADRRLRERDNLFFVDVHLGDGKISGLELARKIRERNPGASFVFITTQDFMAYQTYEYQLNTLDYIIKEDCIFENMEQQRKLKNRILSALRRYEQEEGAHLFVQNGSTYVRVKLGEIVGLHSIKGRHQIEIRMANGIMTANHLLKDIQEKLNEDFIQINKSAIVNMKHVEKWEGPSRFLTMDNGMKYEVSFRKVGEIKKRLGGKS